MYKISSKLLTAILGREVKEGSGRMLITDNILTFAFKDEDFWSDINIYEIMHKGKVWAYGEGFIIESTVGSAVVRSRKSGMQVAIFTTMMSANESQETELVNAACEWVLDND